MTSRAVRRIHHRGSDVILDLRDLAQVQRIAVVGSGGAGKTTLANDLGAKLDLPVIHLDEHYWQPGWIGLPDETWREKQLQLVAAERWIMDGNYSATFDVRLSHCNVVVVLAFPRWRCLLRVLRRWATNRGRPIQAPGCPTRLTLEFLRWIWTFPKQGRERLEAALAAHATEARVIELDSPTSVRGFVASVERAT